MKPLLLTLAILHGGDGGTTVIGLQNGLREGNPLIPQHPALNLSVKTAYAVADLYALKKLSKDSPRLAKWMTVCAIGLEAFAISANIKHIARARR